MQVRRLVGARGTLQRRYTVAAAILALLVVGIIFLFGHLISRSLSRRYLEDVLVSGREEARRLAEDLGEDIGQELTMVQRRQERIVRTLEGLPQRHVWDFVEVLDDEGNVVYEHRFRATEELPRELATDLELGTTSGDELVTETDDTVRIRASIGEVGEVVLGVRRGRLVERVARLRRELLQQTVTVGVLTLVTLVGAFTVMWLLIQSTRRLEAQRRQAEELAALGALAANLAHEIRNPLNSINLNLELLEEDLEGGEAEPRQSLASTRREVGRLARLVTDFLTYARPGEPHKEPVRLGPMLEDVRDFLRAEASAHGIALRLLPGTPDVEVDSDRGQLRQVLLNLALNAMQAVGELEADRRVVELSADADGGWATIHVRDRGPGIPDEQLDRVRRAFYTLRRGGTGLGLAVAERFAVAHGGRIELENLRPGFDARIVLPIRGEGVKMTR